MIAAQKEEQRATKKDWAKAILCSILLLLLLLLLFLTKIGSGFGNGSGSGFGIAGNGPGGDGSGEGIGVGNETGTGDIGTGKGSEDSGDAGGGESNKATMGGEKTAKSIFTFGSNSELAEGINPALIQKNSNAETSATTSAEGGNESDEISANNVKGDKRFGGIGQNTFAIIQPNAVPATPSETGNRFVGGKGRSGKSGGTAPGRSIGGMNVKGNSLGVILDVSGSMRPYLDDLRKEISRNFSNAVFLEVKGCSLRHSTFDPEKFLDSQPPPDNIRESVMDAMMELVLVYEVDSVYWFSDLQDGEHNAAIKQLRTLVWGKEMPHPSSSNSPRKSGGNFPSLDKFDELQNNKGNMNGPVFRLYIRSTDQKPTADLDQIIRESGGKAQVKK